MQEEEQELVGQHGMERDPIARHPVEERDGVLVRLRSVWRSTGTILKTFVLKNLKTGVDVAFTCPPWYVAEIQPTSTGSRLTMVSDKGVRHRLYVAEKPRALASMQALALMTRKVSGVCSRRANSQAKQRHSPSTDYMIAAGLQSLHAATIMKRVILTDSQTKITRLFENPPWRLKGIIQTKDSDTVDVCMVHEGGEELVVSVNADRMSLTNRFKGW